MEDINNILEKLYNGEICPNADTPKTEEYRKLAKRGVELSDTILKHLDTKDKKIFHKYMENQAQMSSLDSKNQFINGFKLSIQLIVESLSNKTT